MLSITPWHVRLPAVLVLAMSVNSLAAAQGIEQPRVPLRTAITEINALRAEYEENYNNKDAKALAQLYEPNAVLITADGKTFAGRSAIGDALSQASSNWTRTTFRGDTLRVFGNTAWETGMSTDADGSVIHYLVVLRRGTQHWRISSVAAVPEGGMKGMKGMDDDMGKKEGK